MHAFLSLPLFEGARANDVEKVGEEGTVGGYFFQIGKHERQKLLILDILKSPEVHPCFLISSLKTTFIVCPLATGFLIQLSCEEKNGLECFPCSKQH